MQSAKGFKPEWKIFSSSEPFSQWSWFQATLAYHASHWKPNGFKPLYQSQLGSQRLRVYQLAGICSRLDTSGQIENFLGRFEPIKSILFRKTQVSHHIQRIIGASAANKCSTNARKRLVMRAHLDIDSIDYWWETKNQKKKNNLFHPA